MKWTREQERRKELRLLLYAAARGGFGLKSVWLKMAWELVGEGWW